MASVYSDFTAACRLYDEAQEVEVALAQVLQLQAEEDAKQDKTGAELAWAIAQGDNALADVLMLSTEEAAEHAEKAALAKKEPSAPFLLEEDRVTAARHSLLRDFPEEITSVTDPSVLVQAVQVYCTDPVVIGDLCALFTHFDKSKLLFDLRDFLDDENMQYYCQLFCAEEAEPAEPVPQIEQVKPEEMQVENHIEKYLLWDDATMTAAEEAHNICIEEAANKKAARIAAFRQANPSSFLNSCEHSSRAHALQNAARLDLESWEEETVDVTLTNVKEFLATLPKTDNIVKNVKDWQINRPWSPIAYITSECAMHLLIEVANHYGRTITFADFATFVANHPRVIRRKLREFFELDA